VAGEIARLIGLLGDDSIQILRTRRLS